MDYQRLIQAFSQQEELTKFALSNQCGLFGDEFTKLVEEAIKAGYLRVGAMDFDETGEEVPLTYVLTEKGRSLL
jgi:CRISPR/Cas system-associated protein Cas10 (large subunit of type III CRISPR-Cas system)